MWTLDFNKKHTLKIFSDYSSIDVLNKKIVIEPPSPTFLSLNSFNIESSKNIEKNVGSYGDESLSLDLTEKIVNIILDNSGSMSWKDPDNHRVEIIKDFINNISSSYPEDVKYSIFEYGGKKVKFYFSASTAGTNPFSPTFNTLVTYPQDAYADKINNIYGIRILRKIGDFSTTPIDGEIIFDGFSDKTLDSNLTEGNNYFYSAYTYDENFHFSDPQKLMVTFISDSVPIGIRDFSVDLIKGSSVVIDPFIKSVWHFNRNDNKILYDFTSKMDISISNNPIFWLDKDEVPVGNSGLRFNGINDVCSSLDNLNYNIYSTPFTIMAWIYPYSLSSSNVPIIVRKNGINIDWGLYTDNDKLRFNVNGTIFNSISSLTINQWNHIAITIDSNGNLTSYINGVSAGTATSFPTSSPFHTSTNMSILMGSDNSIFFTGRVTEISIHSTNRSLDYISRYSSISTSTDEDNGDRLSILKYYIPSDPGLSGGQIEVIENGFNIPYNEQDGNLILLKNISSSGNFYSTHYEDFVIDKNYNFRIFSKSLGGVYSNIFDSLNVSLNTGSMSSEALQNIKTTKDIYPPNNVTLTQGANKNYIQWETTNFSGEEKRIVIYCSISGYPVSNNNITSGVKIFEGDIIGNYFVHEELENNTSYFYSIFTIDRYGRTSNSINLLGIASVNNSNLDIPTRKIIGLSYEIKNDNSIEIFWPNFNNHRVIEGYFDDSFVLFSKITDEFGNVINDNIKVSLDIQLEKIIDEDIGEDIFIGETSFVIPQDNLLYTYNMSDISNGYSTGIFNLRLSGIDTQESLLKNISAINVTITPTFSILDSSGSSTIFKCKNYPIVLRLKNPFKVSLSNLNKQYVNIVCQKNVEEVGNYTKQIKTYDGTYIGASKVFVLRELLSYRGDYNISSNYVNVVIYNAIKDLGSNIAPVPSTENTDLDATTGLIYTNLSYIEQLDAIGQPTGNNILSKYADIQIKPPILPEKILVYIKSTFNGFSFVKKFFVVFNSTLKIDLIPNIPISNGIDTAEQFANVYYIDPNNPDDVSKRTLPPNNTIVEWNLVKQNDTSPKRNIFSTDNVPIANGVYSYVTNGVAENVFVGPITNPEVVEYINNQPTFEEQLLTSKVIIGDLSSEDSSLLTIKPAYYNSQGSSSSYFLMEFDNIKEQIFNDGINYVKATISHNANTSFTKYSNCFRSCMTSLGKTIYELVPGQSVYITASDPNVEIVWGNVIEETDPITGQKTLNTDNATIAYGSTYIELSDSIQTYVYFRINYINGLLGISGSGINNNFNSLVNQTDLNLLLDNWGSVSINSYGDFNGDGFVDIKDLILLSSVWGKSTSSITTDQLKIEEQYGEEVNIIEPLCSCIRENETITYKNEIIISGAITSTFSGKIITLFGGGTMESGLPSTILVPRDSLNICLVGKKVNNIFVDNLVIDGESENELIFDVSYSGYPVKVSTPVFCQFVNYGDKILNVDSVLNYTTDYIYSDYCDTERSYVSIKINSIPKNKTFKSDLYIIVSYDVGLEINRIKVIKLKFYFDAEDTNNNNSAELFTKDVYKIDINSVSIDNWQKVSSLNTSRSLFSSAYNTNKTYVFGGVNGNLILDSVEVYDPVLNTWVYKTKMPTKRFGASTSVNGSLIYVYGGVEYDVVKNKLVISTAVEVYDTIANSWQELNPMPTITDTATGEIYGNAFGVTQQYSGFVYILSGIREISFDGRVLIFNDRVLKYNMLTDTWTYFDVVTNDFYKKLLPVSFIKNNIIYIIGGLTELGTISTDVFSYHISGNTLQISDNNFSTIFPTKYKSGYVTANKLFIVGGEKEDYNYSRDVDDIDFSSSVFSSIPGKNIIFGLNGCGLSYGNDGVKDYLYLIGGEKSGKNNNFLSIKSKIGSNTFNLNNKQGVNLQIQLYNENGEKPSSNINLSIMGYIQLYSKNETFIIPTKLTKYNILFNEQNPTSINGFCDVNLLPRSDDILNEIFTSELFYESSSNIKYRIIPQVSVLDNTYYGHNFINITDAVVDIPYFSSIPGCDINNNNIIKQLSNNSDLLLSDKLYQNDASHTDCNSVESFVPNINQLTDNVVSSNTALSVLNNPSSPFGCSPLFDAIQNSSLVLSKEEYDSIDKNIMIFCDSEDNCSLFSLQQSIDAILNIGYNNVPIIISDISLADDISQTDAVSITNNNIYNYNKICSVTGGQSFTLNNINDIDNYIGILSGGLIGSLGNGYATCIFNLQDMYRILSVYPIFDIVPGSFVKWNISFSQDGYNFISISDIFDYTDTGYFDNTLAKYLKITFQLFSGDIYSSFGSLFNIPSVLSVYLNAVKPKIDYIFVDPKNTSDNINEIVVSTNNGNNLLSTSIIENGISLSSNSCNWEDFSIMSEPTKDKAGKFIIPKRSGTILNNLYNTKVEPLTRIDGFLYRTAYGGWDENSSIQIYDLSNNLIDGSIYITCPRKGEVIFKSKKYIDYLINITNEKYFRIGNKITNYNTNENIEIYGWGYMYKQN